MEDQMDLFEQYVNEPFADFGDETVNARFRATLERVKGQLGEEYPLIIGGERVTTGSFLDSTDPCFPDRVVGRAAKADEDHIEKAFDAAYDAYRSWSQLPMEVRARHLVKLAAVMRRRREELAAWEVFEASKNYLE